MDEAKNKSRLHPVPLLQSLISNFNQLKKMNK